MSNFKIKHLETEISDICNIFKTEGGLSISDILNDIVREINIFNEEIKDVHIVENNTVIQSLYDCVSVLLDLKDDFKTSTLTFIPANKPLIKMSIELKLVEKILLVEDEIKIYIKEEK